MTRSKVYRYLVPALFICTQAFGQYNLSGTVTDGGINKLIAEAEVFNKQANYVARTNGKGQFEFSNLPAGKYDLIVFVSGYEVRELEIVLNKNSMVDIALTALSQELSEVLITDQRDQYFNLSRLNPVEGTAIYAGKKSEVVQVDQLVSNMATNNARQIYSQVVGLNIYENSDGGLQLNVGGRGLDPNRTANFNTRQNGYDISADVLGYPESYYTPPAEALSEIQMVRGAASLQYGTQFGGLINFKFKKPNPVRKIEWTTRQSAGSFGLFSSFNSLSGTVGKFKYYTYFNYKQGDGFRPNSEFDSKNFHVNLGYSISDNSSINFETTWLRYLAQQAGGLTDTQFNTNINFSNRDRNWFQVDWKLFAIKLNHKFSHRSEFSLNLFTLDAERNALGFRGDPQRLERNPITEIDDNTAFTRDLIKGEFNNWGAEARFINRYKLGSRDAVLLVGTKYYQADNSSLQGPGTNDIDANFTFDFAQNPSYPNQSSFKFPNLNLAWFAENIIFVSSKLSITPGIRIEKIKTESEGDYTIVRYDNAGNEIFRQDTTDNRSFDRTFALLGVGLSYEQSEGLELYANISQNYRSVTFSDIRVVNPTFIIDPEIADEKGFTADVGIRGNWNRLSYDIGGFTLSYNNRIGTILAGSGPNKGDRVRKNIGDAIIYGLEMFVDWNILRPSESRQWRLSPFVNMALTQSEYIESEENNVVGRQVEFIPALNLKTGLNFGFKNLLGSVQFSRLSKQYTDAQNSAVPATGDTREGIIGEIPAYQIVDFSLSYKLGKCKIESGINNVLNEKYFTRRATGYPGPGIIPSEPRSFYVTLQFKL